MKELTALQIKELLIKSKIYTSEAKMEFTFLRVKSLTDTDAVGYVFQAWLRDWFLKKKIYFNQRHDSQKSPDFIIKKKGNSGWLEIKVYGDSGASFDIKSWDAYLNLMLKEPYYINADYLIFNYTVNEQKKLIIKNIYLKKIWELCRPMTQRSKIAWPVSLQYKNETIHNLRPNQAILENNQVAFFKNKIEFLDAIQKTIDTYKKSQDKHKDGKWLKNVKIKYKEIFNEDLN